MYLALVHTPTPKVAGSFAAYVAKHGPAVAMKDISYDSIVQLFLEVGVPPSESEKSASNWLFDLLLVHMVDFLRSEDVESAVPAGAKYTCGLATAARLAFEGAPSMMCLVDAATALEAIFLCAIPTGATSALACAPSKLRAAVDHVDRLQSTRRSSPVCLAFRFGKVGQHVMKVAADILSGTAKDEVAAHNIEKAVGSLKHASQQMSRGEDSDADGCDPDDIVSALRLVGSSLDMSSLGHLEDMSKSVGTIFDMTAELESEWMAAFSKVVDSDVSAPMLAIAASVVGLMGGVGANGSASEPKEVKIALDNVLERIEAELAVEAAAWADVSTVAVETHKVAIAAFAGASVDFKANDGMLAKLADIDAIVDGVGHIRGVLQASGCFLVDIGKLEYAALLKSWSSWKSLPCDARLTEEVPALELMNRGVASVRSLEAWLAAHGQDNVDGSCSIATVAQKVMSTGMPPLFMKLLQTKVNDALAASFERSVVPSISLQGPDLVKRLASEGRLGAVTPLLLGNASGDSTGAEFNNIKLVVERILQESGGEVTESTTWPHHFAYDMVKECLSMFSIDDAESASMKDSGARIWGG